MDVTSGLAAALKPVPPQVEATLTSWQEAITSLLQQETNTQNNGRGTLTRHAC